MTKKIQCGRISIGGGAAVSVQSMTNTDTRDVEATLAQIRAIHLSGADIVRVSVFDEACAEAVRELVDGSPAPLVADVHFDHRLAVRAAENGISKLRVNPGNIGGQRNVERVAHAARAHGIPIRIGVNSGSVERDLLDKYGGPTPEAMVDSALSHAKMLEDAGFDDIVIAIKSSAAGHTVQANRLLARACGYPLHLGVTEAGLPGRGTIKSAIGIGALLLDGIGDTIRVSLAGDPALEAPAGIEILRALGLRGVDVVACPTCGRTSIDVVGIAQVIAERTADWAENIRVAVMGCVVNGPGEAREADIGIAGGKSGSVLIKRGEAQRKIDGDPLPVLLRELNGLRKEIQ